ncbi:MAG: hypothetical protein NTZ26_01695 [Candidatus Aminicenantes bacterium]|nr:hypothetical protein [Candidatus Aminicenantes bacterium]
MKKHHPLPALIVLLALGFLVGGLLIASVGGQAPGPARADACLAVSDGGGVVRLLWPVPRAGWTAGGWQILDQSGRELKRVRAGDIPSAASFSPEKAALLKTLAKGLPSFSSDQERESFYFVLLGDIVTDPVFARAAGFSATLDKIPAGQKSYRVVSLTIDGRPTGLSYQSPAVDASVPTLPPPAPAAARALSAAEGVRLFWTRSADPTAQVTYAYFVERKTENDPFVAIQAKPLLLAANLNPEAPVLVDAEAPLEKLVEYRIFGADAFGRRSGPAEISVYHYDHAALEPPVDFKATGGQGRNVLEWKAPAQARPGKILVWRGLTPAGPFTSLLPDGLSAGNTRYEDADVKGGLSYFYQIQVLGANHREGPRSMVVSASPKSASPPARPAGLTAELERTRIRLNWKGTSGSILAGYLVERKDKNGDWVRLNDHIAAETIYDDYGGSEGPATWSYRVRAIALDNQESPPSATVEVVVPDRSLPPAPEILSGDGGGGKAVVRFRPGQPESRSAQFVVLRSGDPREIGVVLGRPLPAAARDSTDPFVEPGAEYWYRVVAIGPNGNRSDPSAAVWVRIGPPPIPAPAAPRADLILKPSPFVRILFAPAPQGLEAVLERKLAAEKDWVILSAVSRGGEVVDADPPAHGKAEYRIAYRTRSGVYGPASPAVSIQR